MRRGKLEQSGGVGSANYQAGRDIVHVGITVTEAREIAMDVYRSNFLMLSGIAEQVAQDRAERITREFLGRLQTENPKGLASMSDPDMQSIVFAAQSGYARSGEPDLGQALVDLLIDRAGQQERDLKTLVLNQAIATLPKLTGLQRRALTVCFLFRYTVPTAVVGLDDFYATMNQWRPIFDISDLKRADLQYLQAAGIGSLSIASIPFGSALESSARGYYYTGVGREDIPEVLHDLLDDNEVFIPCLRDPSKLQINAINEAAVYVLQKQKVVDNNVLANFAMAGVMSMDDMVAEVVAAIPGMAVVVDRWDQAGLAHFELTAAGIAIGHAYWRQIVPANASAPLDVWLSE